jgi:hypothetical protein
MRLWFVLITRATTFGNASYRQFDGHGSYAYSAGISIRNQNELERIRNLADDFRA